MAEEKKSVSDNKSTSNIFVVRHGERIDYVDKNWINKVNHNRYRDPYLADKGIKQCKETATKLTKILNDKNDLMIISSPYIRCCQTASIIAKELNYKSSIKIEPGICEVLKEYPPHFLDNNDINKDKLCEKMIDVNNTNYKPFMTKDSFKKTEYENQCISRSKNITKKIIESIYKEAGKPTDLMLVGHGASCYGMIEYLSNGYGDYVGLSCISHFKLTYDKNNKFKINTVCIGDSSHLSNKQNLRAF